MSTVWLLLSIHVLFHRLAGSDCAGQDGMFISHGVASAICSHQADFVKYGQADSAPIQRPRTPSDSSQNGKFYERVDCESTCSGTCERFVAHDESRGGRSAGVRTLQGPAPPFGRALRSAFLFDPKYTELDSSSYGKTPNHVRQWLVAFQDRVEHRPTKWMARDLIEEVPRIRAQLGEMVNADADDIVMVPNTTTGINTILRSLIFEMYERILHLSVVFPSIRNAIRYIVDRNKHKKVSAIEFNVTYPISDDELVKNFKRFLDKTVGSNRKKRIRVAVLDHIASTPGVILPLERLIPLLKKKNILVVIDAAHPVGQIPVDLAKLQPDVYAATCYKWLFAARSCSMMFVTKELQPFIRPLSISFGYAHPPNFQEDFYWTGTEEHGGFMSVTAALEFRRWIGGEAAIYKYIHQLAVDAGKLLAERFNTEVLLEEGQFAARVDVRLPIDDPDDPLLTSEFFLNILLDRFNMITRTVKYNGKWYLRPSCNVFNDLTDYEYAANVYLVICREINAKLATLAQYREKPYGVKMFNKYSM